MDIGYLLWLQGLRESAPAFVEQFFVIVSAIGTSALLVAIPCLLYWCLDKRAGTSMMFAFSLGALCNQFIKSTVCCYRPWIRDAAVRPSKGALAEATGYSFPSGHTQTATSTIGALGWFYRKRLPALFVGCSLFVLLVAFSRNFLGVHTPQDVLMGLVESIAIIAFAEWLLKWVDAQRGRDCVVFVVSLVMTAAFVAYVVLKAYPMDYDAAGNVLVDPIGMQIDCFKSAGAFCAAMLGWYLERTYIRFAVDPKVMGWRRCALRFAIGFAIVVAFHLGSRLLSSIIVDERWFELVKNFLTVFAAVFLAPLAFTVVERR